MKNNTGWALVSASLFAKKALDRHLHPRAETLQIKRLDSIRFPGGHNECDSSRIVALTMSILAMSLTACSRKAPQAGPPAPEVLVTTVQPRDVPRVLEARRDAGRFHQREHQRAGAGLHRFARLQGRQRRKKGRSAFSDRSAAVRGRTGAGERHSGERQSQPSESGRG